MIQYGQFPEEEFPCSCRDSNYGTHSSMLTRRLRPRKYQHGGLVKFLVSGENRIYFHVPATVLTFKSRNILCLANSGNTIYLQVTTGTINVHAP
jgi:hypothetical protein